MDLAVPLGGIVLYNNLDCLLVSHKNGISTVKIDTLETRDFIHPESSNKDVIYNDLKIDRHNNLWISTSHIDETEEKGSLWKLDRNKKIQLIDTGFKVSNGPAFSPCGSYIYFNDTFAYQTYRYKLSEEKKSWRYLSLKLKRKLRNLLKPILRLKNTLKNSMSLKQK